MKDKKLLKIIEGLAILYECGSKDHPEEVITEIYRTAHLAGSSHKNWEREAEITYQELRKHGII